MRLSCGHVLSSVFLLFTFASRVQGAVRLVPLVTNLENPVAVIDDPLAGNRLFVVEKNGRVKIVNGNNGQLLGTFFSLPTTVVTQNVNEGGLLGMAFHPNYASNGYFFINYTTRPQPNGALFTVIRRLKVSDSNPNKAVVGNADDEEVLRFLQPFDNHNGGQLVFGPKDGMLYIGTGDGGSAGDPQNNGQRRVTLLGKILRINPTTAPGSAGYRIPPDNPYASSTRGFRKEIWHYGLRNPWRFTFDKETGDMYIGDVGQNKLEEISFAPHGRKGVNYVWRRMEGNQCFDPKVNCLRNRTVKVAKPIVVYGRDQGFSVTGGYLYRGTRIPSLVGQYIYGDYGSGKIFRAKKNPSTSKWTASTLLDTGRSIASFGETKNGELLVVDVAGGSVLRLVDN